jgi:hypothetical protein
MKKPSKKNSANQRGFLQILRDMDENKENEKEVHGSIEGPFFSGAVYHLRVRIGLEDETR